MPHEVANDGLNAYPAMRYRRASVSNAAFSWGFGCLAQASEVARASATARAKRVFVVMEFLRARLLGIAGRYHARGGKSFGPRRPGERLQRSATRSPLGCGGRQARPG